jgi:hypothetical protein
MYLNGKSKINLHDANLQKSEILIGTEGPLVLSETLIVPKKWDTNRHEKAIRAQQETDNPWKTIRVLLDTGSSGNPLFMKKGALRASLLLEGLSQGHGGALQMALFKLKRWVMSRYPLWTTRTAKRFTWSLILLSMLAWRAAVVWFNPRQANLAWPGSGVGF